jgi:hypothetical protein
MVEALTFLFWVIATVAIYVEVKFWLSRIAVALEKIHTELVLQNDNDKSMEAMQKNEDIRRNRHWPQTG